MTVGKEFPIGCCAFLPRQSESLEMFERADTEDDVVPAVGAVRIPVFQANVDPACGVGADVVVLVSTEGEAGDVGLLVPVGYSPHQTSPATPDVEHSFSAGDAGLGYEVVEFSLLGAVEVVAVRPQRARVGHAGVQPQPVEFSSDVVVMPDRIRRRTLVFTDLRCHHESPQFLVLPGVRAGRYQCRAVTWPVSDVVT